MFPAIPLKVRLGVIVYIWYIVSTATILSCSLYEALVLCLVKRPRLLLPNSDGSNITAPWEAVGSVRNILPCLSFCLRTRSIREDALITSAELTITSCIKAYSFALLQDRASRICFHKAEMVNKMDKYVRQFE